MKSRAILTFILVCLSYGGSLSAVRKSHLIDDSFSRRHGYTIKDGKLVDRRDVATLSVQEHYNLGIEALKKEDWEEGAAQFRIVSNNFPETPFGKESLYYLGVAYTRIDEYEHANDALSRYLTEQPNGKHFENSLEYKLHVADAFRQGARRHLFGYDKLPKWLPGDKLAIEVYDELVELAPSHPVAVKSLYSKALFLTKMRRYVEAVEAAQLLIHRFPKHELVPEAYLAISDAYLKHCEEEDNNPDLLPLAEINLRRMTMHLPREERVAVLEERIQEMRELCAKGLFETGQFFERTKQPRASVLYYVTALRKYPETEVAQRCKKRLRSMEAIALQLHFDKEIWL